MALTSGHLTPKAGDTSAPRGWRRRRLKTPQEMSASDTNPTPQNSARLNRAPFPDIYSAHGFAESLPSGGETWRVRRVPTRIAGVVNVREQPPPLHVGAPVCTSYGAALAGAGGLLLVATAGCTAPCPEHPDTMAFQRPRQAQARGVCHSRHQ